MTLADQARRAYAPANSPTRTARDAERQILSQATARLRTAAKNKTDFSAIADAIQANRMLWTRLASDVAEPGNGLPQPLRARLFYLAEFTLAHSSKVLRGEAEIGPLVDINTAVIRGLAGQPAREGAF